MTKFVVVTDAADLARDLSIRPRNEPVALDTERAWAAGFFDGEGYVAYAPYSKIKGGKRYYRAKLSIAQNERWPLGRFQAAVGGVGRIYGPYARKRPPNNPYWMYFAEGQHVLTVYLALEPFLGPTKRRQFHNALQKIIAPIRQSRGDGQ